MPLGDGSSVPATIAACAHHTVTLAVCGLELAGVSDRALVLHRWKRRANALAPADDALRYARHNGWIGPAHAERIVATHLGIANLELPPLYVRGVRAAQPPPDARRLRVAGRGVTLDPRELSRYPRLEVLECADITLRSLDFPPALRALRLARIATPVDLREIARLPLRALALEEMRELRGVGVLAGWESLEQLEMLGCWQLTLDEVMPLAETRNLLRAEIDIGGRRKNAELYKRANWAYPWPFECLELLSARRDAQLARNG